MNTHAQKAGRHERHTALFFAVALTAQLAWPCNVHAQDAVSIGFNPPDGTAFIERVRISKATQTRGKPDIETVVTETRYVIRKTAEGYLVRTTPIKPADLRPSAEMASVLQGMLSSIEVEWELDGKGRLVRARGVEAALRSIEPAKPLLAAVLEAFGKQGMTLTQYAEHGWNDRGLFMQSGWNVLLNQPRTAKVQLPLPQVGLVPADVRIEFRGPVKCEVGRCIEARFRYESRDEAIGRGLAAAMRASIIKTFSLIAPGTPSAELEKAMPEFLILDSRAELEDVRVLDPSSGLVYGNAFRRVVSGRLGMKGKDDQVDMVLTETRDYTFTYEARR